MAQSRQTLAAPFHTLLCFGHTLAPHGAPLPAGLVGGAAEEEGHRTGGCSDAPPAADGGSRGAERHALICGHCLPGVMVGVEPGPCLVVVAGGVAAPPSLETFTD